MGLKLQMSERCMTEVLRNVVSFTSMIDCHSRQARAFWGIKRGFVPCCLHAKVGVFSPQYFLKISWLDSDRTLQMQLGRCFLDIHCHFLRFFADDQTLPAVTRKGCFWWLLPPKLVGMQADPQAAEVWLKRMGLMQLRPTAVTFTALLKGELKGGCGWMWNFRMQLNLGSGT